MIKAENESAQLVLEGISLTYTHRNQEVVALRDLSFHVREREFISLLGPSGCGKSSVLHLIAGFIRPTSGRVLLNHRVVEHPGPDRAIVFQNHCLFPWMTVSGNVETGLIARGHSQPDAREFAEHLLKTVGLSEFLNSYPFELSLGMQQRVALARAYACKPDVLLLDEPFASIDAQTAMRMRELLLEIWSKEQRSLIFVTHDVDEAIFLSDRIIVLTPRPAHVDREFVVRLPRPRTYGYFADPQVAAIRADIMTHL